MNQCPLYYACASLPLQYKVNDSAGEEGWFGCFVEEGTLHDVTLFYFSNIIDCFVS